MARPHRAVCAACQALNIRFIMQLSQMLAADVYRLKGRRCGVVEISVEILANRNFRPIYTLRLCQKLAAGGKISRMLLPIAKLLHRITTSFAGMDLPWQVDIGPGFAITHGWGLVISPRAKIGSNVTVFHGVTLGRSDWIAADGVRTPGYPVIENDVWLGPHSVVVGAVTIGEGSRIAAGTVVTANVNPKSLMAGNPASLKKVDCLPDVMNKVDLPAFFVSTK